MNDDAETLGTKPDAEAVAALLRAGMRVRDVAIILGAHERAIRALLDEPTSHVRPDRTKKGLER